MSNFTKNSITVQGAVAIAALVAGGTLEFTRIQVGDGTLPASSSPMSRTSLVNPLFDVNINEVYSDSESQATVTGVFSNAQTQTGFFYRELGLFAKDPATGAEILFCYGNAGDEAEWINAAGEGSVIEKEVHIVTLVGNATEVTATLKSGIYPTIEMTQKWLGLKADLDATAAEGGRVLASQMRFDEIQDLYVDAAASATGADGSEAKPFKTITAALAAFYAGARVVRIKVKAGTYNEAVTVQNAPGTLFHFTRNGEGTVSIKTLTAIYAQVYASDMTFSGDAEGNTVTLANVGNFAFQRVTVAGTSSTSGVASYNSNGFLESVTINGCGTAFEARDGSHVALRSVGGTGNDVGVAAFESVVTLADHKLKATTPYVTANGGAINDSYGTTTFPSNFHPGYYLGDMSTMDALRNALLAEFKKLQSGSSRFVSFAGNIPGGIGEFAEGQMMNATITKTSESGNGYGYVIFSAHNGPIFGYMQIGEGAFKTQTPISLAKWQVISDGKTNVLELPTGIYSMMNVTAAQNLPGTQSGTLIVDKNVGSKHLTFFVDIEPKIFSRTQYKTGVWADWVQYAPYATTEEYGLVRLASEVDVLNEVDEVVMDVPLSYELNDFRRMNKAYAVGDKVNCAFRFEFFLECTKAGTTSGETLDTRKVTFGQVITDGTVKWTVRAHAKSVNGVVPDKNGNVAIDLSGYALDANVVHKTGNETVAGVKTFSNGILLADGATFKMNGGQTKPYEVFKVLKSGGTYGDYFVIRGANQITVLCSGEVGTQDDLIQELCPAAEESIHLVADTRIWFHTNLQGNNIANAKSSYIDTSGNLVLAGNVQPTNALITYDGNASTTVPNYGFEIGDYVKGDTPSKAISARYLVYGKGQSGVAVGALGGTIVGVDTDKSTWSRLYAFKNANGVSASNFIGIKYDAATDTYVTRAPTPPTDDNSEQIATTAWANNNGFIGYKKLTSIQSVKGCFWFDNDSGIDLSELPADMSTADWYGIQYGMSKGNDKIQFIFNSNQVYWRYSDSNLGSETWTADSWTKFCLRNLVLTDADNVFTGSNTFVDDDIVSDGSNIKITSKDYLNQIFKVAQVKKGTLPANHQEYLIRVIDSSGELLVANTFAELGLGYTTAGDSYARLIASKTEAGATERSILGISYDLSAKRFVTQSPTPPSNAGSMEIATVGYVNGKINAITAISTSQIDSICV